MLIVHSPQATSSYENLLWCSLLVCSCFYLLLFYFPLGFFVTVYLQMLLPLLPVLFITDSPYQDNVSVSSYSLSFLFFTQTGRLLVCFTLSQKMEFPSWNFDPFSLLSRISYSESWSSSTSPRLAIQDGSNECDKTVKRLICPATVEYLWLSKEAVRRAFTCKKV